MSYNARDAQFAGFAKLLFDELYDQFNNLRCQEDDGTYEERDKEAEQTRKSIQENIAQRAYDFAEHIINVTTEEMACVMFIDDAVQSIPDMTEWTKEQE